MLIDPNPNVARVTWTYPDVDPDRKYRNLTREEAAERAQAGDEGLIEEVARIHRVYRESLLRDLAAHEKRYNLGQMPHLTIDPRGWKARFAVCHLAQMSFHAAFAQVIVDAGEETALLHPDAKVPEPN